MHRKIPPSDAVPAKKVPPKRQKRQRKQEKNHREVAPSQDSVSAGLKWTPASDNIISYFAHLKAHVPALHDQWFLSDDWILNIYDYHNHLKGDEITAQEIMVPLNNPRAFGGKVAMLNY